MDERARHLGRLIRIWRFPVKSLRAEALDAADVGSGGLSGDRERALVVVSPEHARSGKPYRGKEHGLLHTLGDPLAAVGVAARAGVDVAIDHDGPFFDAAPASVLLDCWLRELEVLVGFALDPLRFRPNLYVESSGVCPPEAALLGRAIDVGDVRLRVVAPTQRCVTPSYDIATGESEPSVLRALVQMRGNVMGVYCAVERPGRVRTGDSVTASGALPAPSSA